MDESERIRLEAPKGDIHFACNEKTSELVLPLSNALAENFFISGGKGSSLASLKILSKKLDTNESIRIPDGLIVTCNAYELMIKHNNQIADSIKNLKTFVRFNQFIILIINNVINSYFNILFKKSVKLINLRKNVMVWSTLLSLQTYQFK